MMRLQKMLFKYRWHLLLILIGLISLKSFDYLSQSGIQNIIYYDSASYKTAAKDIYIFFRGHAYRPILMGLIFGIPYIFGFDDAAVYVFSYYVNVFCWLGATIVLFQILKDLLRTKHAFVLAAASTFIVGNMAFIFHLLSESIFMLFIISGFYCLVKFTRTKNFIYFSIGLSLFILSMLIRPGAKFFAVIAMLYFIPELINNYKSKLIFPVYGSLLLVFIQCVGLKFQFGNFTISYIDAVTYYDYLGAKAEALEEGKTFKEVWTMRNKYIYSLESYEQKAVAFADMKKQLQHNLPNLIKAYFLNLVENASTPSTCVYDCKNVRGIPNFERRNNALLAITQWQNIILSINGILLGIFYLYKSYRKEKPYFIMAAFILYTIFLSAISCNEGDRFNVITFPVVLILLAKVISNNTRIEKV